MSKIEWKGPIAEIQLFLSCSSPLWLKLYLFILSCATKFNDVQLSLSEVLKKRWNKHLVLLVAEENYCLTISCVVIIHLCCRKMPFK